MMTTCACEGSSGMLRNLLNPLFPTRILNVFGQPVKMFVSIPQEIEVEFRDTRLHSAPHRLTEIRDDLHDLQARPIYRCNFPKIILQEIPVMLICEIMVNRIIRQIEKWISHPGVFPIQDPYLPIIEKILI